MEPIQFGNFTLLERISHGGMAEVFRAKSFGEAGFEREVALKVLLPSVATDQEFVNMLIDEAKIAGQLNHANIAQIFDLGVAEERYYIVQEFVKGKDLRAILKHKLKKKIHLDVAKSCYIALKVCEGLHYAHNKEDVHGKPLKLVHRDISPHNVLISDEGEVKIIDFGIAKAEGRATQTMAGLVKGKFAYMSPEQIRGLPVDHRSDIFATGILLHEMLSTRPLFSRSSEFETLKRARSAIAEPPSQFNPLVPKALDAIVLKALARHVDDRYQTAQELRDALWSFARDHNAFEIDAHTGSGKTMSPEGNESSIEIEIASEVRDLSELENRGAKRPGSTTEDDPYEIIIEGSEATELAPASVLREPTLNPAATADDYGEDEDNQTMVDPGLPFGVPGLMQNLDGETGEEHTASDFTPTDHDAQWSSRPSSREASRMETATAANQSPLGATLDDDATSHRDSRTGLARGPGNSAATNSFIAQDASTVVPSDRRVTAPGIPAQHVPSDRRVTTPGIPAQEAAAEGRVTTPTMPAQRGAMPLPDDGAAATFRHSSFDELSVNKSGHGIDDAGQWSGNTPTTLPGANKKGKQPALAATLMAPPGTVPNVAAPAVASTQLGLPPSVQPHHPSAAGQASPGRSSSDLVEPTGSLPLSMPGNSPASSSHALPGASQSMQAQAALAPAPAPSKRIYLLMSALFLLLLAAAATITMFITD